MSFAALLFYLFGALAIVFSLSMLLNVRNTVAAALSLVGTLVALAALFVLLEAHLVAAVQMLVYAGAIGVLMVFVVMLLSPRRDEFEPGRQKLVRAAAALVLVFGLAQLLRWIDLGLASFQAAPVGFGGHRAVGIALYTDYVLLVELIALLLLAGIVAAVVLAKRDLDS